ncbi:MAG TPA: type II toxin-antitoxin system RelE/ParE family toxin [Isosphaeraceae bacterium]|jgi:plasmid stabilization system protein ParE|nr:type II toxin-antitoxin system RelE/ParE family toxin [Isosphaeraceae bacterium]
MTARFLEAARDDLREAVAFYESRQEGLGRRFLEEIRAAVRRIEELPEAWQALDAAFRRCRLRHFPYGVIYRARGDEVLIVAVANLHREPDHWKDRG